MPEAGLRLLYLSRQDVEAVGLTMAEVIEAVESMFHEKGEGRVEMPPKPGIHTQPDAFIHAMPAYIPAFHSAGIKWVSGYPGNQQKGLPYITGLLILNDPETGIPLSVMDCTWITAMRTGAASAVAAKYLARPDAQTLGVLGCGVQGRSNLQALREVLPLRRVYAYDTHADTLKRYVREMAERFGLEVIPVGEPRQAVIGCDVVVTAGPILKHPTPAIEAGWLREGGLACPVDFDSYWQSGALGQIEKFCTDDVAQLEHYRDIGYFQAIPPVYADLGEIVSGRKPGRQHPGERIMAMNLGLALEDMAVAPLVYQRALDRGIGEWLSL